MAPRHRLALAALAAAAIVPASAQAATKTVVAGPLKPVKGVFGGHASGDVDAFSLKTVTVHVGDKVRWKFNGFHSVTFPKQGAGDVPFILPGSGKYAGVNDAGGAPFWFNGLQQIVFNPLGALPAGGKTEDGSALTGSGVPLGKPKPYVLRFTKAGTYVYECVVHPGMEARVRVLSRSRPIPSAAQDRRAAARRLAVQTRTAKRLSTLKLPTATVQGGNDKGGVVQLRFFPRTIHVPVGGSLTMQVKSRQEIHTFSFGPPAYLQAVAKAFVMPVPSGAGPPTLVFNPQIAFPSDPPPALPPYDGTAHGNGFLNTGVLDGDPHSPQPSSAKVTFAKAGTYGYICLVHPFMHGTVVVG